jgi:NAD(P)H-hydrate epimerase
MKESLTAAQMQTFDKETIMHYHMPSEVLMERAALACVAALYKQKREIGRVLVVCGSGNNGGDGFAVARLLWQDGIDVCPVFAGSMEKRTKQTKLQMDILQQYGVTIEEEIPDETFDVIIDSLFGVGLARAITGKYADLIDCLNAMEGYKVAIDLPSGVSADSGAILGTAFHADLTVTFAWMKNGLLLYPGASYAGTVEVCQIGITKDSMTQMPSAFYYEPEDVARLVPQRQADSHKGTYGKVLVIAGSMRYASAEYFSAKAAYLTGAGLVKVYTHKKNRQILAEKLPECLFSVYDMVDEAECLRLKEEIAWADAVLIGPGIDTSDESAAILQTVCQTADVPVVFDADALTLLSKEKDRFIPLPKMAVVTPHAAEAARLLHISVGDLKSDFLGSARKIAQQYGVCCLLKDARSVTAQAEGTFIINVSGNNGMSTGGSGDVLAGVVVSLLGQGLKPKTAAGLGAYIHGLAGDAAREKKGERSMLASDILDGISETLKGV